MPLDEDRMKMDSQRVGPYRIEEELGRGGMGTVYRSFHESLGRLAAVKVLSLVDQRPEDQLDRRFMREARLMSQVCHPNVVKLLDFGQDGDRLFIAMELLDGITLHQVLSSNFPLAPRRMRSIALGLVRGVAALHEAEIVHRDLKPSNIMLLRDGSLKIMDLGLARSPLTTVLTHAGNVSGTVAYMAPEAGIRRHFTPAYDVYQLGMMLHLVFTGLPAFPQPPLWYQVHKQTMPEPALLTMVHDLGVIAGIIRKCLKADPEDRYADGRALLRALQEALDSPFTSVGPRARPRPGDRSTTPLPVGRPPLEEPGGTRAIASREAPSIRREPAALRLSMVVCVTMTLGLTPFLGQGPGGTIGPRAVPGTGSVPSASPGSRGASAPVDAAATQWLELGGTLPIQDRLSLGRGEEAHRALFADPVMVPFHAELRRALEDPDQGHVSANYSTRLEYWPEVPLMPWQAPSVWLEPLARSGEALRPGTPPGPVRRLLLTLRPGESYRLHLPDRTVHLEAPLYAFSREVQLCPGQDSLTVVHSSLGRRCEIVAIGHDGARLTPAQPLQETEGGIRSLQFTGLPPSQPVVLLFFDGKGLESRTLLHRLTWTMVARQDLTNSMDVWISSIQAAQESRLDFAATLRRYSTLVTSSGRARPTQLGGLDELVMDGREFADPRALLKLQELARGTHPQLRRGAIGALAVMRPLENRKLFKEFRLSIGDEADWIQAVEALGRAGDPMARKELLDRLTGDVSLDSRWVQVYARLIPQDLLQLMRDPERAARDLSPSGLRFLDQVAAYLGGPVAVDYLVKVPPERFAGGGRLSLHLALRLAGTRPALARLEKLGQPP